MKKYVVRWEKIRPFMRHYNNFYDHPLSGVVTLNGKWWRFERSYRDERTTIIELTSRETFREWRKKTMFGLMVGWHTQAPFKRYFRINKPRWFWRRVASIYYHGWVRGIFKPIFK